MKDNPEVPVRSVSKLFIVEDHPIMRQGIHSLLSLHQDLVVCGEAGDAPSALERIAAERPDLVILDLTLRGGSGLHLMKLLKFGWPNIKILVLSAHEEPDYLERIFRSEADGFLTKEESPDRLIEAVRQVLRGERYFCPKAKRYLRDREVGLPSNSETTSLDALTDREVEVLTYLGRGLGTVDTAHKLRISVKTVETHRANLKSKLGLKSAPELVRYAVNWVEREKR